jgi:hypothetical protein
VLLTVLKATFWHLPVFKEQFIKDIRYIPEKKNKINLKNLTRTTKTKSIKCFVNTKKYIGAILSNEHAE